MTTENKQKIKTPRAAYAGFLFQTFLKRPFGYIIACVYVVYLAVILLIVPGILHLDPLFIWSVGGFNMPVFNLFFIAASAAALAVSIFRTGREDGTELSLSSKPLTKGSMVAMKVLVYLTIMVVFCAIAVIITALTLPVFGEYNEITNIHGITMTKYIGLNLSVLIGNLINMLFFGAISVLISMVGGQVITMVGTVGIVFLMCLLNFIYPQVVTSSLQVLRNRYDVEMYSYSCPTLDQYDKQDSSGSKSFVTIGCVTDEEGKELDHFDTNEYWLKAERESGGKATNYIDFARQLSSLYNAFGLDESKLKEASKLAMGMNRGYSYNIDPKTHVGNSINISNKNYPISYYGMSSGQGMQYPSVIIIGGNTGIEKNNWYAISTLGEYDFNSVSTLTVSPTGRVPTESIIEEYKRPFFKINELGLTEEQKATAKTAYDALYDMYWNESELGHDVWDRSLMADKAREEVIEKLPDPNPFFTGKYSDLTAQQQHKVISQIHMYWAILAMEDQKKSIDSYIQEKELHDSFPYKSSTLLSWYKDKADPHTYQEYWVKHLMNIRIFDTGIQVRTPKTEGESYVKAYDKIVTSTMDYAETYSNMYQYSVSNFYTIRGIVAAWSIVGVICFTGSIIVYKKTDFK